MHIFHRMFSFIGQTLSGRPSPHFPPELHPDPSQKKWRSYFFSKAYHFLHLPTDSVAVFWGITWHDLVWHGMTWYDLVWLGLTVSVTLWPDMTSVPMGRPHPLPLAPFMPRSDVPMPRTGISCGREKSDCDSSSSFTWLGKIFSSDLRGCCGEEITGHFRNRFIEGTYHI